MSDIHVGEYNIAVEAINFLAKFGPENPKDREVWLASAVYWIRQAQKYPNVNQPSQPWALHVRLADTLARHDHVPPGYAFKYLSVCLLLAGMYDNGPVQS